MGAHRPFCRDCDFNTAGCRDFKFDPEKTLDALCPPDRDLREPITILPFSKDSALGKAYFKLLEEDKRYIGDWK